MKFLLKLIASLSSLLLFCFIGFSMFMIGIGTLSGASNINRSCKQNMLEKKSLQDPTSEIYLRCNEAASECDKYFSKMCGSAKAVNKACSEPKEAYIRSCIHDLKGQCASAKSRTIYENVESCIDSQRKQVKIIVFTIIGALLSLLATWLYMMYRLWFRRVQS